jgi:hypothetical protein
MSDVCFYDQTSRNDELSTSINKGILKNVDPDNYRD